MRILFILLFLSYSWNLNAEVVQSTIEIEEGKRKTTYLKDHESNILGVRYDSYDKDFYLDFKISLQYPLFKETFDKLAAAKWNPELLKSLCKNRMVDDCYPYLAFTGRFAQYIDLLEFGRDSSPVVGKRYNPKIFWRFEKNKRGYFDLEYAHESNGQHVSSQESYNALVDDLANKNKGKRSHANDYISRGWDYAGITAKYNPAFIVDEVYLTLDKYIGGIFQGDIEEFYPDWEASRDIIRRQQVNGFRLATEWKNDCKLNSWIKDCRLALQYETGLSRFAK